MSSDNKELPLVSICIPAYNHEKYVQEAIQSVIDQDYPRIELIVTDDGSKDGTWRKIEEMRPACEKRFERVVLRTRENKGRVVTWQENLSLSQGEFIGIIASDDRYAPGAIAKLVKPMVDDVSIGLSVGINAIIDSNGRRCYWDEHRNIVYDELNAKYRTFDDFIEGYSKVDFCGAEFGSYSTLSKGNYIGNGQLHRKSLYSKIIPYDPKAPLEDWWFNLQFSKVTKFKHIDSETFCYRWHGSNTAAQGEYMCQVSIDTLIRELELLNSGKVNDSFVGEFCHDIPIVKTIFEFKIGRHRPKVSCRYYRNYRQYCFTTAYFTCPFTPKLKIHYA